MSVSSHASTTDRVERLKRELLVPSANDVDDAAVLPVSHWRALADAGLFGTLAGQDPIQTTVTVGEVLSGACLSTAFVWAQHQGTLLRMLQSADTAAARTYLPMLLAGEVRGGVCYAGLLSHGETLRVVDGALHGTAPFITGWKSLDVITLWAYDPASEQAVCFALESPAKIPGSTHQRLSLVAANASDTCAVEFDGAPVHDAEVLQSISREAGAATPVLERRRNATLPLGLLLGLCDDMSETDARFWRDVAKKLRAELDAAMQQDSAPAMIQARGHLLACTEMAAASLFLSGGSRFAGAASLGSRRVREAAFVQASATMPDEREFARQFLADRAII